MKQLILAVVFSIAACAEITSITDYNVSIKAPSTMSVGSVPAFLVYNDLPAGGPTLEITRVTVPEGATWLCGGGWDFRNTCLTRRTGEIYISNGTNAVGPVAIFVSGLQPGTHTVEVETRAKDASGAWLTRSTSQTISIQAIPDRRKMPELAKWQQVMLKGAKKYCVTGTEDYGMFTWELHAWYYDGAKVFFQVADWTGDPLFEKCAWNIARQYATRAIAINGAFAGYRVFTDGLAEAYKRSGDPLYRDAIKALAYGGAYSKSGGMPHEHLIRETAYALVAYNNLERVGEPKHPMADRAVNYLLTHFDAFLTSNYSLYQSFFIGLASHALIERYEIDHDPRIPVAIKKMADHTIAKTWTGTALLINPEPKGPKCDWGCQQPNTDLLNLSAHAFAWYGATFGDEEVRKLARDMFAHSLDTDVLFYGKQFSQNYWLSFKTVKHLFGL